MQRFSKALPQLAGLLLGQRFLENIIEEPGEWVCWPARHHSYFRDSGFLDSGYRDSDFSDFGHWDSGFPEDRQARLAPRRSPREVRQ
jgi:hypothetical protein